MTFITPSIYEICKFLDNPTKGPVHLELFCPFDSEASQNITTSGKGPFIYYVITFLGFLNPILRKHVLCTESKQKLPFSTPPPPPYMCLRQSVLK